MIGFLQGFYPHNPAPLGSRYHHEPSTPQLLVSSLATDLTVVSTQHCVENNYLSQVINIGKYYLSQVINIAKNYLSHFVRITKNYLSQVVTR